MNLVDKTFINLMRGHLDGFSKVNEDKINFRCPYCGDSKKSKSKRRGWFLTHLKDADLTIFKCHNCDHSTNLQGFIKDHFSHFYDDYIREKFLLTGTNFRSEKVKESKPKIKIVNKNKNESLYDKLVRNSISIKNTIGEKYILDRKIQDTDLFRFTNNSGQFIKDMNLTGYDKLSEINKSAIIIPMLTMEKELYAFQFRYLNSKMRYITIKFDNSISYKVWGLDRINTNETVYVTEGVFDAASLPNSIAMCGSTIDYSCLEEFKEKCVFILDNEKDLIMQKKMKQVINNNYSIFIWNNIKWNDVNKYLTEEGNIDIFLNKEAVYGLRAEFELGQWLEER